MFLARLLPSYSPALLLSCDCLVAFLFCVFDRVLRMLRDLGSLDRSVEHFGTMLA